MNNKKATKRALLSSVLALVLCFSMLVGTTFAWFTDTATAGVNTIQSGTLDIVLEYSKDGGETWADAEGQTLNFKTADGRTSNIYWEPGCTYELPLIRVRNNGNLALKYEIVISGLTGDVKLLEAIDFYVNDEVLLDSYTGTLLANEDVSAPMLIKGHMKETAGNEYQTLKIENISISVYATQMTHENDSYGPDYDDGAYILPTVYDAAELMSALEQGESVKLGNDITAEETIDIPAGADVELDLNGYTLNGNIEIAAGAALTVENGTIASNDSSVSGIQNNGGELVLDDVNITSARHGVRVEGGTVTINGGEFKVSPTSNMTLHALNVSDGATVTINGGTFIGPKGTAADSGSAVCVQADSTVTINGGNFSGGKNSTLATKEGATLTVTGGTFDQDPSAYVALGYHAVENNGLYYVVPENVDKIVTTRDELQKALDDATGDYTIALAADITGDVIVTQKEGVNITIDGNKHEYDGSIEIYGQARYAGTETLTIKNIHFVADEARDFVHCNTTESAKRYAHNVTIEDCTFTSTTTEDVVATRFRQCYNIVVKNCIGTNLHSVMWATGGTNITVDGVTATCTSGGVSFGTSTPAVAKNCKFTVTGDYGYGVRFDASSTGSLTVENNTIIADAPVLVRKATGNATVILNQNTLTSAKGNDIILTNTDYVDDSVLPAPTGDITLIIDGATQVKDADTLVEVLENGGDVILTDDVKIDPASMSNAYGTTGINVKNGQTIEGNGKTLDIKGAGGTWDSGINTTGGLIKNITVTGSFRGIFINHNSSHSERVVLENVTIQGTTYTISCDQGTNQGLTATKSTFKGWTSYAATLGDAKFVDCYFGEGNGYAYCRPYAPTEFVGCDFEEGFVINPIAAIVLDGCYYGDTLITAENIASFNLISGDSALVTVQ